MMRRWLWSSLETFTNKKFRKKWNEIQTILTQSLSEKKWEKQKKKCKNHERGNIRPCLTGISMRPTVFDLCCICVFCIHFFCICSFDAWEYNFWYPWTLNNPLFKYIHVGSFWHLLQKYLKKTVPLLDKTLPKISLFQSLQTSSA